MPLNSLWTWRYDAIPVLDTACGAPAIWGEDPTFWVISGLGRHVEELCILLGYYAALSGSSVPTFRDNLSVRSSRVFLDFLTLENETDRLSRNVGT
jgi:hypothetical protein